MVQILPTMPTFGQQLIPALAEAGNTIAQGLIKRNAGRALQHALGSFPMSSPFQNMIEQTNQNTASATINPMKEFQLYQLAEQMYGPQGAQQLIHARLEQQKLANKEAVQHRKENIEAFKITQPYREQLLGEYEAARNTLSQLGRMETLNKEGKLTSPAMAKIAELSGIPLSILSNPDSEEFQKLSQDLMRNITKYFGNRILKVEVENFLKTIPTLTNSQEGRARIIHNMKILLKPQQLAYSAYKDIRKGGGRIPLDLHEKVLEKIYPQLEKLAEEFKSNPSSFLQNAPQRFISIQAPNGQIYRVPPDQIENALQAGGKTLNQ